MSYIQDFKTKIGQIVFQNQLKSNKRKKEVCNLDTAKSIGILYEAQPQVLLLDYVINQKIILRKKI